MEDTFIKALKEKEKELTTALSAHPIFKQLESVRNTIATFQNIEPTYELYVPSTLGNPINPGKRNGKGNVGTDSMSLAIPTEYSEGLSWKDRTLFAVSKLKLAPVRGMVEALKGYGAKEDEADISRQVSINAYRLKLAGVLGEKKNGRKSIYFIKTLNRTVS